MSFKRYEVTFRAETQKNASEHLRYMFAMTRTVNDGCNTVFHNWPYSTSELSLIFLLGSHRRKKGTANNSIEILHNI